MKLQGDLLSTIYEFTIATIIDSMQNRFEELSSSPLFKNLVSLLDVSFWLKELSNLGSTEIESLKAHFSQLLSNNGCDINEIQCEWMTLKSHVTPIWNNSPKVDYLEIWERVSLTKILKNAKMSFTSLRYFSLHPFLSLSLSVCSLARMLHVKNDWCNRLSCARLSVTLIICEEGPDIEKFNPDVVISERYDAKVHRLTLCPHN